MQKRTDPTDGSPLTSGVDVAAGVAPNAHAAPAAELIVTVWVVSVS